jgi:hypothetical protein
MPFAILITRAINPPFEKRPLLDSVVIQGIYSRPSAAEPIGRDLQAAHDIDIRQGSWPSGVDFAYFRFINGDCFDFS